MRRLISKCSPSHNPISLFESGSKPIRVDAYLPETHGTPSPAVIALYGSTGGVAGMSVPASMLAGQGFAVFVVHYFDRTDTKEAIDKPTIFRHFPVWGKTVWDAISFVEKQPQVD